MFLHKRCWSQVHSLSRSWCKLPHHPMCKPLPWLQRRWCSCRCWLAVLFRFCRSLVVMRSLIPSIVARSGPRHWSLRWCSAEDWHSCLLWASSCPKRSQLHLPVEVSCRNHKQTSRIGKWNGKGPRHCCLMCPHPPACSLHIHHYTHRSR